MPPIFLRTHILRRISIETEALELINLAMMVMMTPPSLLASLLFLAQLPKLPLLLLVQNTSFPLDVAYLGCASLHHSQRITRRDPCGVPRLTLRVVSSPCILTWRLCPQFGYRIP